MFDWQELFVPAHPISEIILRGTNTYIMLFLILRFLLKRQSGVIGIADLLVVVLIADAAQNAMASEYKSIAEGAILVLTVKRHRRLTLAREGQCHGLATQNGNWWGHDRRR
jgi:hypothetical protein